MKRTILTVLCLAAIGTFAIVQAQEDTDTTDCENCVTANETCCCGGTVEDCTGDCDDCDECDCDSESEECTDCEDCTEYDSNCDECTSEEAVVVYHCGGCH